MATPTDTRRENGDEDAGLEAAFGRLEAAVAVRHGRTPRLRAAFELAAWSHAGQRRRSGEPYLTHPLAVAEVLAGYGFDADTVAAGLLHDVVEDSPTTLDDIAAVAGPAVAGLVDGVTKLARLDCDTREERQAAALRKLVVAMSEDLRVLVVKLADRLHNVRTLDGLDPARRRAVAEETLDVYAPLAHRLGAQELKHELEDVCFRVLHPLRFEELDRLITDRAPHRDKVISQVLEELLAGLDAAGLDAEVSGRPKRHYSIYRKMTASGLTFDEIHDLIGIRVVVADVPACYAALGVVHGSYQPLHGRFKDYIALPKFNLYQSLHTTVLGPDGRALEIQIRSRQMHELAEFGAAAHWRYKEGPASAEVPWLADLGRLQREQADPAEFLRSLKLDLYHDEIVVTTPKGDMVALPQGSTPVDLAYWIHTEVGNHCVGARVNGRMVALDTPLRSGDIVEVLTSNRAGTGPSKDWAAFARTTRARHGIRHWFNRHRRSEFLEPGRARVAEALGNEGIDVTGNLDDFLSPVVAEFGFPDIGALLVAVGEGTIDPASVASVVAGRDVPGAPRRPPRQEPVERLLLADGLEARLARLAQCCRPEPGDTVVGFLTAGRGLSAHRYDCLKVGSFDQSRLVELTWADAGVPRQSFQLRIEALDRAGLLAEITTAIAECGGFVGEASVGVESGVSTMVFELRAPDRRQAELVLRSVRSLGGVYDVSLSASS